VERPAGSTPPPDEITIEADPETNEVSEESWRSELLGTLQSMSPRGFERLCAQLLREEGCEEVVTTRFVGDEGVDGVGLLRVGLLSFPVYFQAKRYAGSVGPEKVREFRGALAGRADKGILITTGRFTKAATDEASRAGSPIDLVDGDILCDLLLKHSLGVRIRPSLDQDAIRRFEG
jgi:restriction system protein